MKQNKKAFTLIEIMLVVVIIGILAAMVVPSIAGRSREARITTARVDIDANITTALDLYEMDNGAYPTTEQGLSSLLSRSLLEPVAENWAGPYLKKRKLPKDPWSRPYVYKSPGIKNTGYFDLYSLGPDGIESEDDICNWE